MAESVAENKVTFGLKKAHYSVVTVGADNALSFGPVKPLPGATELSTEAKGELSEFYADDTVYYTADSNQGYEGSITLAEITNDFRVDVLGETLVDGVLTENANAKIKTIALLFEFDGDVKATRHVLYYVKVSRPGMSSSTKTDSTEPNTVELSYIASPRPDDGVVKRKTTAAATEAIYNAWYSTVFEPTQAA